MRSITLLLSFWLLSGLVVAQVSEPRRVVADSTNFVDHSNQIELILPAHDGIVQWNDIASSIADTLKLDQESVQTILPRGQINLRSETVLLLLMGINLAAGESIHFALVRDEHDQPALRVRCDARMFGDSKQATQHRTAGIEIDRDWQEHVANRPLVICLHGLQSQPGVFNELRSHLRNRGYATAAMSYDYNQPIVDSAAQVALIVERLFHRKNSTRIALIGHSMGGLVAREWTENENLSGKRIEALITVGTPHHGSNWAGLPPLLDLFTSGNFDAQDLLDVILHQPSSPGLRDLVPESDFLQRLNLRSRRDDVAYTNVIGTGSPVDDQMALGIRDTLRRLDQDGSLVRLIRPRIAPLLGSFDELSRGRGDGVVSVERAMLDGIDNTIKVDLSHFDMIRAIERPDVQRPDNQPVWDATVKGLAMGKSD